MKQEETIKEMCDKFYWDLRQQAQQELWEEFDYFMDEIAFILQGKLTKKEANKIAVKFQKIKKKFKLK